VTRPAIAKLEIAARVLKLFVGLGYFTVLEVRGMFRVPFCLGSFCSGFLVTELCAGS
jgi:hypothetical protein